MQIESVQAAEAAVVAAYRELAVALRNFPDANLASEMAPFMRQAAAVEARHRLAEAKKAAQ